jgi:hypothetical protein
VTRVFSHEEDKGHLPSISEDEAFPTLSKEISPTSQEKIENVPVPVEQIDRTLDGITLKSAALTSSFDTGITSPQFASPARSPTAQPNNPTDGFLHVDVHSLLSPLDEKLKRHAGHTPMAFDGNLSSGTASVNALTPKQEKPFAPASTTRPSVRPSENSDSYFSFTADAHEDGERDAEVQEPEQDAVHDAEEDPALQGPLMLDSSAKSEAANVFLEKVDAKLSEEVVHRSRHDSSDSQEKHSAEAPARGGDDDMPVLKIKNSMNFGSAWGGDMPGRI